MRHRSVRGTTSAVCAAGLLFVVMPGAQAAANGAGATPTRFSVSTTETFQGSLPECFSPDLVGTNVATETTSGRLIESPSGVFTVSGTNVFDYRVDFPNGMYAFGTGTGSFAFAATNNVTVSTEAGSDLRTVYAADGTPIAKVRIHAVSHVTYRDRNEDGQPQPDEISASVDRFFFTCQ